MKERYDSLHGVAATVSAALLLTPAAALAERYCSDVVLNFEGERVPYQRCVDIVTTAAGVSEVLQVSYLHEVAGLFESDRFGRELVIDRTGMREMPYALGKKYEDRARGHCIELTLSYSIKDRLRQRFAAFDTDCDGNLDLFVKEDHETNPAGATVLPADSVHPHRLQSFLRYLERDELVARDLGLDQKTVFEDQKTKIW